MPYKNKDQQREYQRIWMSERRASYLRDKSCVDCGSSTDLEIDHIEPDKKVSHRIWSWSKDRIEQELEKCVTRCSSCHKVKTFLNNEKPRGVDVGTSKLTEADIVNIRKLFASGSYTKRGLARQFDVDEKNIRLILKGSIWKHI